MARDPGAESVTSVEPLPRTARNARYVTWSIVHEIELQEGGAGATANTVHWELIDACTVAKTKLAFSASMEKRVLLSRVMNNFILFWSLLFTGK